MRSGDRIVVVSGIFFGYHGKIVDLNEDGNRFICELDHYDYVELKPFDIELETRSDLWPKNLT